MPVYNGAEYLDAALASIAGQTMREFELIVVDDGSTDETPEILRRWTRRDARFRTIRHETNRNVASARNTGLAASCCDLVAQADADDVNVVDRFQIQLNAAEKHPHVAIIGSDISLEGGRILKFPRSWDSIKARGLWEPAFGQNAVLFNRRVLKEIRYNPQFSMAEDLDLWMRTIYQLPAINLPIPLVTYRQHEANLSHQLSDLRLSLDRRIVELRSKILGVPLDENAGLACSLGNRVVTVGARRMSNYLASTTRAALHRGLATEAALRKETRRQIYRMWRFYGKTKLKLDFIDLTIVTLAFAMDRGGWKQVF